MFDNLDPILLARIQFAFTISFHIIFPAFTIGLASWLAVIEWRWLKTGNTLYAEIYRMWVKIFAVAFGMGVVSGIVMSFQFGTNWSVFSDKAGNVLGPLLGYEVLDRLLLGGIFSGRDAFRLESGKPTHAFCVDSDCGFWNAVVCILDPFRQQLDANPAGLSDGETTVCSTPPTGWT